MAGKRRPRQTTWERFTSRKFLLTVLTLVGLLLGYVQSAGGELLGLPGEVIGYIAFAAGAVAVVRGFLAAEGQVDAAAEMAAGYTELPELHYPVESRGVLRNTEEA